MTTSKPAYASRTIQGSVMSMIAILVMAGSVAFQDGFTLRAAADFFLKHEAMIVSIAMALASTGYAIYGRVVATQQIGRISPPDIHG